MAQLPIKRLLDRVPGGMMIVPLLLGSLIASFFPDTPACVNRVVASGQAAA